MTGTCAYRRTLDHDASEDSTMRPCRERQARSRPVRSARDSAGANPRQSVQRLAGRMEHSTVGTAAANATSTGTAVDRPDARASPSAGEDTSDERVEGPAMAAPR